MIEWDGKRKEKSLKTGTKTKRSEPELRATENEMDREKIVKSMFSYAQLAIRTQEHGISAKSRHRCRLYGDPSEQANESASKRAERTKCFQYHLR